MSYEKKEVICLGRSFHPGMLYDCRSDALIPTLTLWNLDKLNNAMNSRPKPYTNYELITEDTLSEKSSKLGVDASLKLSFLSGMVSVSGSAHYLNDRKQSSKQERLTLKYSTSSRFDALSMDLLCPGEIQYPNILKTGDATHVVIAVEYGADAIFVFDRDVSSSEDQHEVSRSLQVAMNLLIHGIEGEAMVKMSQGEKESYEKIRCTFYGDVTLDRSPATLKDAIRVYQELPKTIEKCGPVPKKAWLYPLAKLDNKAAKLVREISPSLVNKTEMILEKLHEAGIEAEDILQLCHPIFEKQKQQIESFQNSLDEFKIGFQKKLLPILPQIRGGGMEEEKLADLLKEMLNSTFSPDKLQLWLKKKKHEIELLNNQI